MKHCQFDRIKMLVYDCDGVLTDNKVIVDEHGIESASFNRGDGLAISLFKKMPVKQIVLSTESNPIVLKRCAKLNLEVHHSVDDKYGFLKEYCISEKIDMKDVMYIGNDINDLECMLNVGIKGCPKDAEEEILQICDWVSSKNGGSGVIRDLYRSFHNSDRD